MQSKEIQTIKEDMVKYALSDSWKEYAPHALIGGGGALAAALLSGGKREEEGEDSWDYTKRILRNALIGGSLLGGASLGLSHGYEAVTGDAVLAEQQEGNTRNYIQEKLRHPLAKVIGAGAGLHVGNKLTGNRNDAALRIREAIGDKGFTDPEATKRGLFSRIFGGPNHAAATELRSAVKRDREILKVLGTKDVSLIKNTPAGRDVVFRVFDKLDKPSGGAPSASNQVTPKMLSKYFAQAGIVDPRVSGNKARIQGLSRSGLARLVNKGSWKSNLANLAIVAGGAALPGFLGELGTKVED